MAKSNPNGANQYDVDPRQALMLGYYLDPKSETFSNIYQSAVKAGYGEGYAKSINSKVDWLDETTRDIYMVKKAESNLKATLESVPEDATEKNIKHDANKFVVTRLGKDKWSERKELTAKDGKDLFVPSEESKKLLESLDD